LKNSLDAFIKINGDRDNEFKDVLIEALSNAAERFYFYPNDDLYS
jgi:hypothetical protein